MVQSQILRCVPSCNTILCVALLAFCVATASSATAEKVCEAEGTCESSSGCENVDSIACVPPTSIYGSGGTAVAYAPNQPFKSIICNSTDAGHSNHYRAARWPWTRTKSRRAAAPTVSLKINLHGCESKGNKCCCRALNGDAEIDVWQTRPDGTYSSLTSARGECRARYSVQNGRVDFSTVAPGSTGSMGGLGPGGWDTYPYGPPVIHLLVKAASRTPLLVDIPILFNLQSLEQNSFWGGDFRGAAWVRKSEGVRYRFVSWKGYPKDNRIETEIDVFLHEASLTARTTFLEPELCRSFLYGFPSSFFLEPIALCAPSLLDFFDL
jgi:hypothetical protein